VVSGPPRGGTWKPSRRCCAAHSAGEGDLTSRLESWIRPDQKGWLFNNGRDRFSLSHIFGFDMTKVLDDPIIRTASLLYIFHRLEELLDGTPVMLFLDEGWRLLDDAVFSYSSRTSSKPSASRTASSASARRAPQISSARRRRTP